MQRFGPGFWKTMPFLRLLLPLMAGILLQFHYHFSDRLLQLLGFTGLMIFVFPLFLSAARLFSLRWLTGVGASLLFLVLGANLVNLRMIENNSDWIGRHYQPQQYIVVTIQEPLIEKARSYKTLARAEVLVGSNQAPRPVAGNILLYFQKASGKPDLQYGQQLLIRKPLQPITNSGNPGGFDYKRYAALQHIHYQAFLKNEDYQVLSTVDRNWFQQSLINARKWVLSVIRRYIHGNNEAAVAEALLIGYRENLDRELVQSYSNTGVVHIIAISGLHLGMIYGAMTWLFLPLKRKRWSIWMRPISILLVLWVFTFIAGAVPSILRSAVMFSCIIAAEVFARRSSIYNTLAASAFLMLLINPFYLWDVGFQLSYAAVLSIVAFSKPISNWFYFRNKLMAGIWNMSAVTLSAQILTMPIILYHFHQFPNLFLFTNFVAVPLSGIILFAEIGLLLVSFIPALAAWLGAAIEWMIWILNTFIERTDRLPFAVTDGIYVDKLQAIFIYCFLGFAGGWLLQKNKRMMYAAAASLLVFIALRSVYLIETVQQSRLVVYNVPQHTAIDVMEGTRYAFYGDAALTEEGFLRNFHLRPSRIINRVSAGVPAGVGFKDNSFITPGRKVVVLNEPLPASVPASKTKADVVIVTGNPRLYMSEFVQHFDTPLVVFDASNPLWKIRLWKKDCESLHLRHYSVPEKGAFIMNL